MSNELPPAEASAPTPAIDMHAHSPSIVPGWLRAVGKKVLSVPTDPLSDLRPGRVDLAVITAVGDPMGTRWRGRSAWAGVVEQLTAARTEAAAAGITVVTDPASIARPGGPAIMLGVEGADTVGTDPQRLTDLHELGVRVLGLVHYADNGLGTIGMSAFGGRGSRAVRAGRRSAGLSPLGKEVVAQMNRLGMLIDLAHADFATTMSTCEHSTAPVVSSHTAASAVQDFPRFISDTEVRAIAATGGLIGLWPARLGKLTLRDVDDFARHAAHLAQLVGAEHLCVGTDMNGVTGYIDGYDGPRCFPTLAPVLATAGFDSAEVHGILGGNALRVLKAALSQENRGSMPCEPGRSVRDRQE
ncbi:dipeptidase [Nocardia suismassiliense]|uniref:dipeptidase n=1 Tax=Nocardia suismassiliense TaxID=2077092 RepID=UPI000D1F7F7B|nr:membrane dipeptidase [Nocardia suismassiliense]